MVCTAAEEQPTGEPPDPTCRGTAWPFASASFVMLLFSLFFFGLYGYMHWRVVFVFETPSPGTLDGVRAERAAHVLEWIAHGYRLLALAGVVFGIFAALRRPLWVGLAACSLAVVVLGITLGVVM